MLRIAKVYWLLLGAFVLALGVRGAREGLHLDRLGRHVEYLYSQTLTVHGSPSTFRLTTYVPDGPDDAEVLDERLESADLSVEFGRDDGGRLLVVEGDPPDSPRRIRYSASIALRPVAFHLESSLPWPEDARPADLAATDLVQSGAPALLDLLGRLFPVSGEPKGVGEWRTALASAGVSPLEALQGIFHHCRDGIRPATFSGTTDALTALRLGEASCGGKSRLLLALGRTIGFPGRIVGGVLMGNATPKRASHVWVEFFLGDRWVPFDPLNGHFAKLPGTYLPLYRGDRRLLRYSRGLALDYAFASPVEIVPGAWREVDLRDQKGGLPLLRRANFSLILLAPFALLFVVFARQVVGVDSIGIFLPVLLGYSLLQTGWALGSVILGTAIALGVLVRFGIQKLDLLHVPRTAVLITFVVAVLLALSTAFESVDLEAHGAQLLVPLAALAMTIERYAYVAVDRGQRDSLFLLGQTLLLAAGCRAVLSVPFFKALTIAFPEILLLVTAEILVIGGYRGLRLTERWRFRSVEPAA